MAPPYRKTRGTTLATTVAVEKRMLGNTQALGHAIGTHYPKSGRGHGSPFFPSGQAPRQFAVVPGQPVVRDHPIPYGGPYILGHLTHPSLLVMVPTIKPTLQSTAETTGAIGEESARTKRRVRSCEGRCSHVRHLSALSAEGHDVCKSNSCHHQAIIAAPVPLLVDSLRRCRPSHGKPVSCCGRQDARMRWRSRNEGRGVDRATSLAATASPSPVPAAARRGSDGRPAAPPCHTGPPAQGSRTTRRHRASLCGRR